MVPSFRKFLTEEVKTAYFTFGRMNPPTVGHGRLMDALKSEAATNPYRVFVAQSQDSNRNPLDYKTKVKFIRKMFPKHSRNVILDPSLVTIFDIAQKLYDENYTSIVMVVGSDRVTEFETLLAKYNGKVAKHGQYKFESIRVVSAGDRDPDGDDTSSASASKQRQAAKDDDFVRFSQGVPASFSDSETKALFNAIRAGMNLKECHDFTKKVEFSPPTSREEYISGNLFDVGDKVRIRETQDTGIICHLGTNYVIVEYDDGSKSRKWIDAVEKINTMPTRKISNLRDLAFHTR